MPELWIPGAKRPTRPCHPGGELVGGPPRMTHHITWDSLHPRPPFHNVVEYLAGLYDPTFMIEPFTGETWQYFPDNRSGYALEHNEGAPESNRRGRNHIQIEWYFSPGVIVDGKRYPTLASTPMRGLEEMLALAAAYDVPAKFVYPGGPKWTGNPRDSATWANYGGHYGHCNVPANTHTDPGPMHLEPGKAAAPVDPKHKGTDLKPDPHPWPLAHDRYLSVPGAGGVTGYTGGRAGEVVHRWQSRMIARGWHLGPAGADGKFGAHSQAVAKAFQREKGFPHVHGWGTVGPVDWKLAFEAEVT